jgi:hypothetical protein
MSNLYMYYLGGTAPKSNIEVHDVQFAVVDSPEQAYSRLAKNWFGDAELLHVDVEAKINWIDGYDVTVTDAPDEGGPKLFFVHMGGYVPGDIDEKHSFDLVVASDKEEAKQKAKDRFNLGDLLAHKDVLFDVDGFVQLNMVDGKHLRLVPNSDGQREEPTYGYRPIGGNDIKYDVATDTATAADGSVIDDVRT